ncbi:MAG: aminotransferase class I/II-fold pyridoxal phosphate-dependent enzyme [Lachnotalea sp.]
MNKNISNIVNNIQDSGLKKFFDLANEMEDVLSLGVGEPDFETPRHIRDVALCDIQAGKTKYTATQGTLALRQSVADYLSDKFQLQYNPTNEVLITIGASEGIDLAIRTLVNCGDEVLVVEPCYVSYIPCVMLCGGIPISVATKMENEFRVTPKDIEDVITNKTKVILLSFPNNPTGAIMEKVDLESVAKVIIKHNLFVISDEIYGELTYGRNHVSIAELEGMRERTIVLGGFSKAFAMTGWRLGFATGPTDFIQAMHKIHQYSVMTADTVSQAAGVEALTSRERDKELAVMRDAYDERRNTMVEGFRKMGLECFEPLGAFYVFPCIKKTGMTSAEFCNELLKSQKVAVIPGDAFGTCGEGYIRCSYAYSLETITECLDRIEQFIMQISLC